MTDFKVNGDANGSTHIAGNGVQWRRADEIWSIVADPGVPDDPETTCQDILDSVDGKMTLQWFQAAADHNSAADTAAVQANWAVPQAALGSGSHTYLSEAGFASLLSKLTAQGYPTINDTVAMPRTA